MQQSATGVFRVRFAPSISAEPGGLAGPAPSDEPAQFARELKAAGAMVVHGAYPDPVTIGASRAAAARIGNLSFVEVVDPLVDPD
ncbi:hypothetical protein IU449_01335 [Nocardia higoensis]|uniref:Uncharacterized protein n=1 Tax=Nocardia higoensis TaxID=228599 RepID=A0ABS0D8M0_9NOCA|nr:hypothetical protein [Nocardia higoensis]MBF6353204.1 hypothetical protein [Nocardia higoensis]